MFDGCPRARRRWFRARCPCSAFWALDQSDPPHLGAAMAARVGMRRGSRGVDVLAAGSTPGCGSDHRPDRDHVFAIEARRGSPSPCRRRSARGRSAGRPNQLSSSKRHPRPQKPEDRQELSQGWGAQARAASAGELTKPKRPLRSTGHRCRDARTIEPPPRGQASVISSGLSSTSTSTPASLPRLDGTIVRPRLSAIQGPAGCDSPFFLTLESGDAHQGVANRPPQRGWFARSCAGRRAAGRLSIFHSAGGYTAPTTNRGPQGRSSAASPSGRVTSLSRLHWRAVSTIAFDGSAHPWSSSRSCLVRAHQFRQLLSIPCKARVSQPVGVG